MSKSGDQYQKLTSVQIKAVKSMFRFYDLDLNGKITKERAVKILKAIGVENVSVGSLHSVVNCKELLSFIDEWLPDPDPPLQSELLSFTRLVAKPDAKPGDEASEAAYVNVIKPKFITDFFDSIDQPIPNSAEVISELLTSMLEWDECMADPSLHPNVFMRDVTKFAKKTNALRDFV
jgi:hypothetical protein